MFQLPIHMDQNVETPSHCDALWAYRFARADAFSKAATHAERLLGVYHNSFNLQYV